MSILIEGFSSVPPGIFTFLSLFQFIRETSSVPCVVTDVYRAGSLQFFCAAVACTSTVRNVSLNPWSKVSVQKPCSSGNFSHFMEFSVLPSYFFSVSFNIVLASVPRSSSGLFIHFSSPKPGITLSSQPHVLHACPTRTP